MIKFLLTETAAEELSDKKHQGPNKDGLSRLGERFQFGLKKASEKAGQVMDDVKEKGRELYDKASDKAKEAVESSWTRRQERTEKEPRYGLPKKTGIERKESRDSSSVIRMGSVPGVDETREWTLFEKNDKCGFKDKNGKVVIPCVYEYIDEYPFLYTEWEEGVDPVTVVCKNGKYGVINSANEIIIPIKYDGISWVPLVNGFSVGKNGKEGITDATGKFIFPLEYDEYRSSSWLDGYIFLRKADQVIVIGENGVIKRRLPYDYIGDFEDVGFGERALVRRNGRWGYIDKNLDEVTPCVNSLNFLSVNCNNTYTAEFSFDNLPKTIESFIKDSPYSFKGHEHQFKKDQKVSPQNIGAIIKILDDDFILQYRSIRHSYLNEIGNIRVVPMDRDREWGSWFHAERGTYASGKKYSPDMVNIRYEDIKVPREGLFIGYNMGKQEQCFRLLIPEGRAFDPSALLIVNNENRLVSSDQAEMTVMYNWQILPYLGCGKVYKDYGKKENMHIWWDGEPVSAD